MGRPSGKCRVNNSGTACNWIPISNWHTVPETRIRGLGSAMAKWSRWRLFPDPRLQDYLTAPFGPGVYELRIKSTEEPLLFGKGNNCAARMSSLLPSPHGTKTRNNEMKPSDVLQNLGDVEYRTFPCKSGDEAYARETKLKRSKQFRHSN